MDILFKTGKLKKTFNNSKACRKAFGKRQAELISQRLDDLRAAMNLEVMRLLTGRCHELKGDRAGQLSLDLVHPYRLIFEPYEDPLPKKDDGGLDWSKVTSIMIIEVDDTHDQKKKK